MYGFLEKRSGNFHIYQLRWFQREGHELKYYATKDEKTPNGVVDLYSVTKIKIVKTGPGSTGSDSSKREFLLEAGDRVFGLRAKNKELRDAWVEALVVWTDAKAKGDHIPIPRRLFTGMMACIDYCIEQGMDVEGLFRVPGSLAATNDIVVNLYFNGHHYVKGIPKEYSVFDVGSAIKKALRDLPEPLLTHKLLPNFKEASTVEKLKEILTELPERNFDILKNLFRLCKALCDNKVTTSMHPGAVASMTRTATAPSLSTHSLERYSKLATLTPGPLSEMSTPDAKKPSAEASADDLEYPEREEREIKSLDEYYDEFQGLESKKDASTAPKEFAIDAAKIVKDASEVDGMSAVFSDLRNSPRLKADAYRELVAQVLVAVQSVVGDNVDLSKTIAFGEHIGKKIPSKSLTSTESESQLQTELKMERRRSTLLASRVVDLERLLAKAQEKESQLAINADEIINAHRQSERNLNKALDVIKNHLVPVIEQAKKLQERAVSHFGQVQPTGTSSAPASPSPSSK